MGRPINKRFFGDMQGSIKITHYRRVGGVETAGEDDTYIVKQRTTNKFLVADTSDNWSETLTLVDKPAGSLAPGEFRIKARSTDGDLTQVTKFYNRTLKLGSGDGTERVKWDIDTPFTAISVEGITLEGNAPVVVSVSDTSRIQTGDIVTFSGITGTTELNRGNYTVGTIVPDVSIELDGSDSTLFSPYISGGVVSVQVRSNVALSGITLAGNEPVLILVTNTSRIQDGDIVTFSGITGTTELHTGTYTVNNLIANTSFELTGTDSTLFTPYVSGGTISVQTRTDASVTGITLAGNEPVVISVSDTSRIQTGDRITFSGVTGTELNSDTYTVGTINPNTNFQLAGTDSTLFSPHMGGGTITVQTRSGVAIDGVTLTGNADVVILVADTSRFQDGDTVTFSGVGGAIELNTGGPYTVGNITNTSFDLVGVDSTTVSAWSSGGVVALQTRTGVAITGITLDGNAPVIISVADTSRLRSGDTVTFSGITGTTELHTGTYTVGTIVEDTSFELDGSDSTRFTAYTRGGVVHVQVRSAIPITSISLTDNAAVVVTVDDITRLRNEDVVTFSGVGGTTELNSGTYTVGNIVVNDRSFELVGTDSTSYTAWDSGGVVSIPTRSDVIINDIILEGNAPVEIETSHTSRIIPTDVINFNNVGGAVELNTGSYQVGNITSQGFTVNTHPGMESTDSTTFSPYTNGGTFSRQITSTVNVHANGAPGVPIGIVIQSSSVRSRIQAGDTVTFPSNFASNTLSVINGNTYTLATSQTNGVLDLQGTNAAGISDRASGTVGLRTPNFSIDRVSLRGITPVVIEIDNTNRIQTGDTVRFSNVGGTTILNTGDHRVGTVVANTSFSLNGTDSSEARYAPFTSGGTADISTSANVTNVTFTGSTPVTIQVENTSRIMPGDIVDFDGLTGGAPLNDNTYSVGEVTPNSFTLEGQNGRSFTAYTSGGTTTISKNINLGGVTLPGITPVVINVGDTNRIVTGDTVSFSDIVGTTQLNSGGPYTVGTVIENTSFELAGTNSATGYTSWDSGGTADVSKNVNITGVTLAGAVPVIIRITDTSRIQTGDTVSFTGVVGTTELNAATYTVGTVNANTSFELAGTNSGGNRFGMYTSGGLMTVTTDVALGGVVLRGITPVVVRIDSTRRIQTGDTVSFTGITGTTQLNTGTYTVGTIVQNTSFELAGTNSATGFSPYSGSGGTTTISNSVDLGGVTLRGRTPVVVRITDTSRIQPGDTVKFSGIIGTTELNTGTYTVGTIIANTSFELDGTDSSVGFSPYMSDGNTTISANVNINDVILRGKTPVIILVSSTNGIAEGDTISFADIEGTTELNGGSYKVGTVVTDTSFELDGTDSSVGFSTYTMNGTILYDDAAIDTQAVLKPHKFV